MVLRQIIVSYLPKIFLFLSLPLIIKILTNSLSIDEFGSYSLINNLANYLFFVGGFGAHRLLARDIPGIDEEKQYKKFSKILSFEVIFYFFFLIIIGFLLIPNLNFFHLEKYRNIIIFFLVGNLFYLVYNEIMRFIGLQKKLELKSILASIDKPLMLCGVFILYYLEKLSIENVFIIYFFGFVLLSLIASCFIKLKKIIFKFEYKNIFPYLKILFPLFLVDLVFKTNDFLPRYSLSYFNSNYDVGLYTVYENYSRIFYLLITPMIFILYPYIASFFNKKKFDEFFITLRSSFEMSLYAYVSVSIVGLFYLQDLIPLISNETFLDESEYIIYFFIANLFMCLIAIFQPILILYNKPKIYSLFITLFLLSIVSNLILINLYGLFGSVISKILVNFAIIFGIYHMIGKEISNIFNLKFFFSISFYLILIYQVLIQVNKLIIGHYSFNLFISATAIGLIFIMFQNKNIKYFASIRS